jgi:hypothetical protein
LATGPFDPGGVDCTGDVALAAGSGTSRGGELGACAGPAATGSNRPKAGCGPVAKDGGEVSAGSCVTSPVAVRPAVCAAGAVSAGGATRPAGPETGGCASPADFSPAELGDVEQPAAASSTALKKVTINAVNLFPWTGI